MCNKYIIWKENKLSCCFLIFHMLHKSKVLWKIFWLLEKESQRNVFLPTIEIMIKHAYQINQENNS